MSENRLSGSNPVKLRLVKPLLFENFVERRTKRQQVRALLSQLKGFLRRLTWKTD